jgi:hypothetical protein
VKPSDVTASGVSLSLPQLELSGTGSKTGSIAERGEAVRASMHAYFDNTWAITEVHTIYTVTILTYKSKIVYIYQHTYVFVCIEQYINCVYVV